MPTELDHQVFTAPQAPDYLGHYSELLKSIPNAGLEFQKAATLDAQRAQSLAQYQLLQQKAKAFMELYPAFKAAQIAKLNAETGNLPVKGELLKAQADYQRAHAASIDPNNYPAGGSYGLDAFDDQINKIGGGAKGTPGGQQLGSVDPFASHGVLSTDANPAPAAPAATPESLDTPFGVDLGN